MSNTDAAKPLSVLPAADHLPDDPVILKRMIQELLATLHERDRDLEATRARLHLLLQRLYGPRSERFDPSQPLLFPDMTQPAEPAPARIGSWFANVPLADYESVGELRFIDWSNEIEPDSLQLERQRDLHLVWIIWRRQLDRFPQDHEIQCKSEPGYMGTVCPVEVCG